MERSAITQWSLHWVNEFPGGTVSERRWPCMGWKCVPQMLGLVRGEPEPEQKHRANGLKIAMEAGKERASKSKTLDRSRSKDNEYWRCTSGAECWAAMEADAEAYRVTGTNKNGKQFSRKLRADAVIGWAMIFHPPEEVTEDWSPERKKRFRNDSWRTMMKLEPRLFRKENVRMMATHRDEDGEHWHLIGDARDQDGRYCGNLLDRKHWEEMALAYAREMRALKWDIEDPVITDWKRYGTDPEYRAMIDAYRAGNKGGLTVDEYAASAAAKRAEDAAAMYGDAEKALQEAQEAAQEAQRDRDEVKAMLGQTRRVMGAGEAQGAKLAARRLPKLPGE